MVNDCTKLNSASLIYILNAIEFNSGYSYDSLCTKRFAYKLQLNTRGENLNAFEM